MNNDDDFRLRFGKRVRLLRVTREISQEKLGMDCGLDQSYISAVEHGKRNITLGSVRAIAVALGVTLSALFEGLE